jgi:inosine-uridine nucleoside N-ribohydrolase
VAAVVEPDVLHGSRAAVEVEVSGEPYGRTVFDWSGDDLTVATSADPVAYLAWLRRVLGAPASR